MNCIYDRCVYFKNILVQRIVWKYQEVAEGFGKTLKMFQHFSVSSLRNPEIPSLHHLNPILFFCF